MKRLAKDNKGFYLYKGTNQNLIKIVFDNNYDYAFAVGGDKDNVYSPSIPYDANYKSKGYEKYLVVNGSIFFSYRESGKLVYDACGVEVIEGKNNQSIYTDTITKYNNDMSLVVMKDDLKLKFVRQEDIIYKVDAEQCYCALTGIGIMLNGEKYPYGTAFTTQYNSKSARTLIGFDKEGNFLSYSNTSGLYGKDLYDIAKANGFYTCLCLDGGGSVYRYFNGNTDISTTRKIKNNFIIYRKKKSSDYKELYEKEKEKINKIKEIVNV